MPISISEDEIDDLLYFARTGDSDFHSTTTALCARELVSFSTLLLEARDPESLNGPLHMAAANGHTGRYPTLFISSSSSVAPVTTSADPPREPDLLATALKSLAGSAPQNATQLEVLNLRNSAGNTALHWAALNGHLECVKVLLESGADATIVNKVGHDAVFEAEINDRTEVVEWVLREGEGLEEGIGGISGEGDGDGDEGAEEDTNMDAGGVCVESMSKGVEGVEKGMQGLNTEETSVR